MTSMVTLAFWIHTGLCAAFLGVVAATAAGLVRIQATDQGPGTPDWGEGQMNVLLFAAGSLYLAYAELYLYQMQSWSQM
jgi:hypothetical protein